MEISEKRERIAVCIVSLKKGLKKIRRQDIDEAIQLLLFYDGDLKKFSKLGRPVEAQGAIKYKEDFIAVQTKSADAEVLAESVKVVAITNNGQSVAWPFINSIESTVAKMTAGEIEPIANIRIDSWMKEHYTGEASFMSVYASVVTGHLESKEESIVVKNSQVFLSQNGITDVTPHKVTNILGDKVWIDRGWFKSLFSVKISDVVPVHPTRVNYFVIDKWW